MSDQLKAVLLKITASLEDQNRMARLLAERCTADVTVFEAISANIRRVEELNAEIGAL